MKALLRVTLLAYVLKIVSTLLPSWKQTCGSRCIKEFRVLKDNESSSFGMSSGQDFVSRQQMNSFHMINNEKNDQTAPEVNQWTEIMSQEYLQKTSSEDYMTQLYQDLRDMSNYDTREVEKYWARLMPTVSYLGTERVAKVYDALRVAYRAHRGQMRKSGEPFIIHPVEVAILLADLNMDAETVMSGLLHDTVEDTDLTFDQVETMFGTVVRSIVEGETKVSKLPKLAFDDYADEQAENLRQMFIAMTDDYRIIIVKLADRLHNMRTLRHMKPEKQIKISRETLDIFAPLAHRMGIWQFKSELEDIAFMYLYPQEYRRLNRLLTQHSTKYQETLDKSKEILRKTLRNDRTLRQQAEDVQVYGRTKELYSLWYKMETKADYNLDHIADVVALRVIINPKTPDPDSDDEHADRGVWLCYHVLGLVQHLPGFQPVPTRVKDYISFPKPNGYQSLHTALMLNGQKVEVQIRTTAMHEVAENGMAAHWAYIDEKRRGNVDLFNTPWLSSIKEWQNDRIDSREFVDSVRRELLGKRVFVFLRNGKILNLARGATAIDAAFQIHTEVGLNMHGVEINGKPVPFSYVLQNGDVVSILTGEGKPQNEWMHHATSRSTRAKLRSYFREKRNDSLREAGKILVMDYLWMHGPLIEENSYREEKFKVPMTIEELHAFLPGKTRYYDVDDLLIDVGKNQDRNFMHQTISKLFSVSQKVLLDAEKNSTLVVPSSVTDAIHESMRNAEYAAKAADEEIKPPRNRPYYISMNSRGMLKANDTESLHCSYSNGQQNPVEYADIEHLCEICLPILGDEIIGTRPLNQRDGPATVHRVGCSCAQHALNQERAARQTPSIANGVQRMVNSLVQRTSSSANQVRTVQLQWADSDRFNLIDYDSCRFSFLSEIEIVAGDRKLLLADCSVIVSEKSEIVKTGSVTTNEHATLSFLVKVASLKHLQELMDELGDVQGVMSVQRRFGRDL
eukprot:CAMPEP_0194204170 /NCGR_PEP_ID=MMETSP0156-20130528/3775_1 /TAXON_ID=33649 /ORGANISM="Thalassionema nitzschioides, Strain L26-B" /LENGTH=964 /DNA_ID=CAMNT_0038930121 /DNA_START=94 /DNA_END=2988 /DNA_ORIENTATION=+